ncbi:zinc transporter ZIP10 [Scleropages formosus]|uniref:zinc transporter ZIP10 n=1 Tax=Scleropages formosus TaxID=113540 RepID=UPI0010FA6917|nr:zinc transporter ZIP10-like [Scleropages formosus]
MSPLPRCWMCLRFVAILVSLTLVWTSQELLGERTYMNETTGMEHTSDTVEIKHRNETALIVNETSRAANGVEDLEEALKEQGYYLQRLFLQYGENGTLSFGGLQKLLGSLGLGEVTVLEIHHQDPKHSSPGSAHVHDLHPPALSTVAPYTARSIRTENTWVRNGSTDGSHSGKTFSSGKRKDHNELSTLSNPNLRQPELKNIFFVLDHPTKNHLHGNCLNVSQLLWNFGLGEAPHITPSHFTLLCPALLYQIDSRVCLRHSEQNNIGGQKGVTFVIALGWGALALVVISLPSLLAIGTVPLLPPARLHSLLRPMAALAVGTLCGDALLHLLPHASPGTHTASGQQDAVLKGLCVLAGIYLLFVVEGILELQRHHKRGKKERQRGALADRRAETELTVLQGTSSTEEGRPPESMSGTGHGHSHVARGHAGMASLVWMVVTGDGIHNFTDGLAIGAAFSQSVAGGLSTTVAVFCHELPHELGDLAVLLAVGWPVKRLLLFSALSTVLGFVGLLAGTVLGHHFEQLSPWILGITAGVFLYVALTDMMPEMLRGGRGNLAPVTGFLLQNLGLLTGGAIMLSIAFFEEDIAFNLGDN